MSDFKLSGYLELQGIQGLPKVSNDLRTYLNSLPNIKVEGLDKIGSDSAKASQSVASLKKEIISASTGAQDFADRLGLSLRRVAAFTLSSTAIYTSARLIFSGLKDAANFERELLKVQQVANLSAGSISDLREQITKLGQSLAAPADDLAAVALELKKAGLSVNEVKSSLELLARTRLTGTFGDLKEAAEALIVLRNEFHLTAGDSEKALASINAIASNFSVNSSDLIEAIKRIGGAFLESSSSTDSNADSLKKLQAIYASVKNTTQQNPETISTGLRTLIARLQQPQTLSFFKDLNIDLTDAQGKFIGVYESIQKIGQAAQGLDKNSLIFSRIVDVLGGTRQINVIGPLLKQTALQNDILSKSFEDQGRFVEQANAPLKTLVEQFHILQNTWAGFSRDVFNSPTFQFLAHGAIDLAESIVKVADSISSVLPLFAAFGALKIGASIAEEGAVGFLLNRVSTGKIGAGHADGGFIGGYGVGDNQIIRATPGEYVIRKGAADVLGPQALNYLNNIDKHAMGGFIGKHLPAYAGGGIVSSDDFGPRYNSSLANPEFRAAAESFLKEAKDAGLSFKQLTDIVNNVSKNFATVNEAIDALQQNLKTIQVRSGKSTAPLAGGGASAGNLGIGLTQAGINVPPPVGSPTRPLYNARPPLPPETNTFLSNARANQQLLTYNPAIQLGQGVSRLNAFSNIPELPPSFNLENEAANAQIVGKQTAQGFPGAGGAADIIGGTFRRNAFSQISSVSSNRTLESLLAKPVLGPQNLLDDSFFTAQKRLTSGEENELSGQNAFVNNPQRGDVASYFPVQNGAVPVGTTDIRRATQQPRTLLNQIGLRARIGFRESSFNQTLGENGVGGFLQRNQGKLAAGAVANEYLGGPRALTSALGGAAAGATFGPYGALAGGIIGGAVGLVQGNNEKERDDINKKLVASSRDLDKAFGDLSRGGVVKLDELLKTRLNLSSQLKDVDSRSAVGNVVAAFKGGFGPSGFTDTSAIDNLGLWAPSGNAIGAGIQRGAYDASLNAVLQQPREDAAAATAAERNADIAKQARGRIEQLKGLDRNSDVTDNLLEASVSDDPALLRQSFKTFGGKTRTNIQDILLQARQKAGLDNLSTGNTDSAIKLKPFDDFASKMARTVSLLEVFNIALESSSKKVEAAFNEAQGNYGVVSNRQNPFDAIQGLNKGQIQGAIGNLEGFIGGKVNPDASRVAQSIPTLNNFTEIVNSQLNKNPSLDARGTIQGLLKQDGGPLGDLPDQIKKQLSESFTKASEEDIKNTLQGGPTEINGKLKNIVESTEQYFKKLQDASNNLAKTFLDNAANQRSQLLVQSAGLGAQSNDAFQNKIQTEIRLGREQVRPESVIAGQLKSISGLAGGFTDPAVIGNHINDLLNQKDALENNPVTRNTDESDDQFHARQVGQSEAISQLAAQATTAKEGLGKLAQSALGLAEIQTKLADLDRRRAGVGSLIESDVLGGNQRSRIRGQIGERLLEQGGDLKQISRIATPQELDAGIQRRRQEISNTGSEKDLKDFNEKIDRILNTQGQAYGFIDSGTGAANTKALDSFNDREQELLKAADDSFNRQLSAIDSQKKLLDQSIDNFDKVITNNFIAGIHSLQDTLSKFSIPPKIEGHFVHEHTVRFTGISFDQLSPLVKQIAEKTVNDSLKGLTDGQHQPTNNYHNSRGATSDSRSTTN